MSRRITIGLAAVGATIVVALTCYVLLIVVDGAPGGAFRNVSGAMAPAVLAGDYFTVRAIGPSSSLRRGEVVAHRWPPDRSQRFVKRVVGLPGDTIEMVGGHVRIDGVLLPEPYAWLEDSSASPASDDFRWQRAYLVGPAARDTASYVASRDDWGPLLVPQGSYFVLGDNRDNSLDSRYWGFLPRADVLGEVRRIYLSLDSTRQIRWSRLGHLVH